MAKSQAELDMLKETFPSGSTGDNANQETSTENTNQNTDTASEKKEKTEDTAGVILEVEEKTNEGAIDSEKKEVEIADDALMALLKKRGIDISSLEDLKPKVDPAAEAEKRESKKITYALENNLISKKEYDSFVSDNSNKNSVVYAEFAKEMKESDADITDDQIQEEFDEVYATKAEPDSLKYKRGQKILNQEANRIIQERHSKYFGIDAKFNEFEKQSLSASEKSKKIKEQSPLYAKAVEDSINELAEFKFNLGDNTYGVKIPKESVDGIKSAWLDKNTSESNILADLSKDHIKGAIRMSILEANFEKIINSVVNKKLEAKAKGVQNIPNGDPVLRQDNNPPKKEWTAKELEYLKESGLGVPQGAN